jgi:hypothetical protein
LPVAGFLSTGDRGRFLEEEELLQTLQVEQQRIQQEMAKILQRFKEGQLDSEGFSKFYDPLKQRSKQIEQEIPHLQSEIDISR